MVDAEHTYQTDTSESSGEDDNALFTCLLAMTVVCIIQFLLCVLFAYKGCKAKFSPDPPPYSPWNPFSTGQYSQRADIHEPPPAYVTVESEMRDTTSQRMDTQERHRQCDVNSVTTPEESSCVAVGSRLRDINEPCSTSQRMDSEECNRQCDANNVTPEELSCVAIESRLRDTNEPSLTSQRTDSEECNRQGDANNVTPEESSLTSAQTMNEESNDRMRDGTYAELSTLSTEEDNNIAHVTIDGTHTESSTMSQISENKSNDSAHVTT